MPRNTVLKRNSSGCKHNKKANIDTTSSPKTAETNTLKNEVIKLAKNNVNKLQKRKQETEK